MHFANIVLAMCLLFVGKPPNVVFMAKYSFLIICIYIYIYLVYTM